jgi:PIN domain nuclease of toxin-antitoxin system
MRLLIDTHALLWWLTDDSALPASARKHLARSGNTVFVSSASAWEIATKFRIGKLPDAGDLLADFAGYMARERFEGLPISTDHAVRAGLLPGPHKDPFDRMLIAQAQSENLPILSNDVAFDTYSVRRLW